MTERQEDYLRDLCRDAGISPRAVIRRGMTVREASAAIDALLAGDEP